MHPELSAHPTPQRAPLKRAAPVAAVRFRRWYVYHSPLENNRSQISLISLILLIFRSLPLLATIAIGYGFSQYNAMKTESPYSDEAAEKERLRKNAQLMEAYGYKDNVDDIQKAMEAYEVQ